MNGTTKWQSRSEKTEVTYNSGKFTLSEFSKLTKDPQSTIRDYTGPQTAQALLKTFDEIYNNNHLETTVTAIVYRRTDSGTIQKKGKQHVSEFTNQEIDIRYPKAEWLQLLLDNGITIESFREYAYYLSKRYTLAFLEDNPSIRNPLMKHIPTVDNLEIDNDDFHNWDVYKTAFIYNLVNEHIKEIQKAAERIEQRTK